MGATGYIGGRLVPRLLDAGYGVRCVARVARKLRDRSWALHPRVEILQADLSSADALLETMRGCGPAYYLIPAGAADRASLASGREIARRFAEAARLGQLTRIVYLRALGQMEDGPRPAASEKSIEDILATSAKPVTVLRAAMIIGSGSASFEMLRYLVERLPFMVTPRWTLGRCQPIAVRNVLEYLIRCLTVPETAGMTLDIGGPDVLTYQDVMAIMAEKSAPRRRIIVSVPFRLPRLSAVWIHLVTPITYGIAAPLVRGLSDGLVCRNDDAVRLMPQRLLPIPEAIGLALLRIQERNVQTAWSSAGPVPGADWTGGPVLSDSRSIDLAVPPAATYGTLCRLGGRNGWYAMDFLWRIRGALDRLIGGPGLRRGRRDPEKLAFGDAVDFWRVTGLEPDRLLRLRAEMKVAGVAELEFGIEPRDGGGGPWPADAADPAPRARLTQTARFRPHGLAGLAYWYAMAPFHRIVFRRMLEGIRIAAERSTTGAPTPDK